MAEIILIPILVSLVSLINDVLSLIQLVPLLCLYSTVFSFETVDTSTVNHDCH
jgi:hypothetical protein